MFQTRKEKLSLSPEELKEINELNEQFQSKPKSMSDQRKERLWTLMNKLSR